MDGRTLGNSGDRGVHNPSRLTSSLRIGTRFEGGGSVLIEFIPIVPYMTQEDKKVINVVNARRLIKRLESEENPVDFNMSYWFDHNGNGSDDPEVICQIVAEHPCGTAACLAGHAALEAWESGDMKVSKGVRVQETAQMWLGLEYHAAKSLFHGHWGGELLMGDLDVLTVDEAITEVNRLITLQQRMDAEDQVEAS